MPWIGRFWDHQWVGGYRFPMQGEVAWVVDGGLQPYWRGRLVDPRFDTAGPE
ncbi:MAG: DUF6920 family protein [Gemmatimonadota bacterium]